MQIYLHTESPHPGTGKAKGLNILQNTRDSIQERRTRAVCGVRVCMCAAGGVWGPERDLNMINTIENRIVGRGSQTFRAWNLGLASHNHTQALPYARSGSRDAIPFGNVCESAGLSESCSMQAARPRGVGRFHQWGVHGEGNAITGPATSWSLQATSPTRLPSRAY